MSSDLALAAAFRRPASPSVASAQVITHRDVGVRMGLAIADAALTECERWATA